MFEYCVIRPGATDFDVQGRIQGTLDVPLTELGVEQVAATIEQLREKKLTALYTSPTQSARQTARAIAEALGVKCKSLDRLANVHLGLWQGMLVEQVRTKQPKVYRKWQDQPESVCPPEGEMIVDAKSRVAEVLAKLQKKHKEGVVGLVLPEPLASIVCHILSGGEQLCDLWDHADCGSWEVFGITPAASAPGA